MIDRKRFGLNRIACPSLGLGDFLDLASSAGLSRVELRNDLGGKDPIDGLGPAEAARLLASKGAQVISINALQKFNLASRLERAAEELDSLLTLARAIGCPAIVLCPNNDAADARGTAQRAAETVAALKSLGPRFEKAGILGFIEPLGFSISSLSSLLEAQDAIRESGFSCYRIVHDSFHHHIGPDEPAALGTSYDVGLTGLVHLSGVEADIPLESYRDAHRVLVGPSDRLGSREQVRLLDRLGYRGVFSFEPFAPAIQGLSKPELQRALEESLGFLAS